MTKRYLVTFIVELSDIAPSASHEAGEPPFGVDDLCADDIVEALALADTDALAAALFADTDMAVAVAGLGVVAAQAIGDNDMATGPMVGWDKHRGPVEILDPEPVLPRPRLVTSNGEAA